MTTGKHTQHSETYFGAGKKLGIPSGYRLSHKMHVSPPVSERLEVVTSEAKPPPKSVLEACNMWEKVKEHVGRHNSLPTCQSGESDQIEMHKFLMTKTPGYNGKRVEFIHTDGVCKWKPIYDTKSGDKCMGWYNNRTGQVTISKEEPLPIMYDCLVSSAEMATWVKPGGYRTGTRYSENKPGQGK